MLSKFDIEKLQDLPIEQVAEALGLSVSHHKALCPFHADNHPSLTFHRGKNRYKCYVCDAHGGVIDLVMKYLNKNFLEACKWLNDEYNVILTWNLEHGTNLEPRTLNLEPKVFDASRYARFFARPWLSNEARKFLFEERRLDPRVVRYCQLTSWKDRQGVPWLQIPYYDREGKLIGVQNRNLSYSKVPQPSSLNPQPSAAPRFRFPSGAQCSIYNLPILNLLRPGEPLFIAEGASDCWSLLSSGHKAIAIPSATLLSKKDIEILSTLNSQLSTVFHIFPDQDTAGEQLYYRLVEAAVKNSFTLVRHDLPKDCKDFSDLYLKSLISPLGSAACNKQEPSSLLLHQC